MTTWSPRGENGLYDNTMDQRGEYRTCTLSRTVSNVYTQGRKREAQQKSSFRGVGVGKVCDYVSSLFKAANFVSKINTALGGLKNLVLSHSSVSTSSWKPP